MIEVTSCHCECTFLAPVTCLSQGCGSGSGTFSVEEEARKIHRLRFQIGGKNGERKEIGSAILRRRTNRGSLNIKK